MIIFATVVIIIQQHATGMVETVFNPLIVVEGAIRKRPSDEILVHPIICIAIHNLIQKVLRSSPVFFILEFTFF